MGKRRQKPSTRPTEERPIPARLPGGIRYYRTVREAGAAKRAAWDRARKNRAQREAKKKRQRERAARNRAESVRSGLTPEQRRAWDRISRHLERAPGSFRWADIRKLYYAQKCRCFYCGEHLGGPPPSQARFHIDHKKAVALGGTNERTNLCVACPSCNMEKSAAPLRAYIESRKRRGLRVPSDAALHPDLYRALEIPDKQSNRKARAARASDDPWESPSVVIRRRPERGKADRQEVPSEVRIDPPLRPLTPPSRKAQAPGGDVHQSPAVAG